MEFLQYFSDVRVSRPFTLEEKSETKENIVPAEPKAVSPETPSTANTARKEYAPFLSPLIRKHMQKMESSVSFVD